MMKRARLDYVPKDVAENVVLMPELRRRLNLYKRACSEMDSTKIFACKHVGCDRRMIRIKSKWYLVDNIQGRLDAHDHRRGYLCKEYYKCYNWYCKDHMPNTEFCEECQVKKA